MLCRKPVSAHAWVWLCALLVFMSVAISTSSVSIALTGWAARSAEGGVLGPREEQRPVLVDQPGGLSQEVVVAGWQLVDDLREHCLANIHAECTDRTADVPGASSTTALITLQIRAARSRNREAGKPPRALRHAAAFTLVPSAARLSRRSSFIRDSQVRHHWPDAARAFRVRSGGLELPSELRHRCIRGGSRGWGRGAAEASSFKRSPIR